MTLPPALPPVTKFVAATTGAIVAGSIADRIVGDPRRLPHFVRGLGGLIAATEQRLRRKPGSPATDRRRGVVLVTVTVAVAGLGSLAVLTVTYTVSAWLGLAAETFLCCQCLAVKSLRDESSRVGADLATGDLPQARADLAMIVGRDTAALDETDIARAAVETVAENTADAVVAPLLAMTLAGGCGGVVYKAVNTLDSMVGYRDERYRDFGRAAAKLDDVVNWLPARLTAGLLVAAARLTGDDWRGAWRIWRRDHAKHASPNSAQAESACAGALGIQLGGPASYNGQPHDKPLLGAPARPAGAADIGRANRLMSRAAWLGLGLAVAARTLAWGVIAHVKRH